MRAVSEVDEFFVNQWFSSGNTLDQSRVVPSVRINNA
jgi:hypothetical protein